ncbi:hypothetical protein [Thermogymnomonas acidicola]|uniref:hypothetical protein n=1 Tax=Thermogymnomonas acidicola TaxID=399579 RepID=UPI0009461FAA|nr:hypothetical protein [Thermogymnomonas acidicola]
MFRDLISLGQARELASRYLRVSVGTEEVNVLDSVGRISSEHVFSGGVATPPFDRSTVDGFAVRSADLQSASPDSPVALKVYAEQRIGREAVTLPPGGGNTASG